MISPLKDPNDFKSTHIIKNIIPKRSTVNSFLLYSGNIEFNLAESERFVVANTNNYVIYEFWHHAFRDPQKIIHNANFLHEDMVTPVAYLMQENWPSYEDPYVRTALFFLLSSYSSQNLPSCGDIDFSNFNPINAEHFRRLPDLKNFYINYDPKSENFLDSIDKIKKADYNLFPVGKFSYNLFEDGKSRGHETTAINHEQLRKKVQEDDTKSILVYKYHPALTDFFKGFDIRHLNAYGRPTDEDSSKEVLIANFRIT